MEITIRRRRSDIDAYLEIDLDDMPHNAGIRHPLDLGALHPDSAPNLYIRAQASHMVARLMRTWHNQMVDRVAEALLEQVRKEIWGEAGAEGSRSSGDAGAATIIATGVSGGPGGPLTAPTLLPGRPDIDDGKGEGK